MGLSIAQILGLMLALSAAANAALGWFYLGERDALAKAGVQLEQASSAAIQCSVHTDELYQRQEELAKAAAVARAAAAAKAAGHDQRAEQILTAPPSTPGNACKSALDLGREWLRSRGKR